MKLTELIVLQASSLSCHSKYFQMAASQIFGQIIRSIECGQNTLEYIMLLTINLASTFDPSILRISFFVSMTREKYETNFSCRVVVVVHWLAGDISVDCPLSLCDSSLTQLLADALLI